MSDSQEASQAETLTETTPVRRRRLAVRVVVGVLLVAGMVCGWTAMGRQQARKQTEAIQAVTRAGGNVYFDYQWKDGKLVADGRPQQAAWLRKLVGSGFFDRVVAVDLRAADDPGQLVQWLRLMPYMVDLNLGGTELVEGELQQLGRLHGLRRLDLSGTVLNDQGLMRLDRLTQLVTLSLASTQVTDRSLEVIGRFKKLKDLDLTGTSISDVSALSRALPDCRIEGP